MGTVRDFLVELRRTEKRRRCEACGRVIHRWQDTVRVHDTVMHRGCAMYRRRP